MQTALSNDPGNVRLARLAAVAGIVSHFGALVLYVLFPMLVAPPVAVQAFSAAWLGVLAFSIRWFRAYPWRSALLPLVGAIVVGIVRILGEQHLGWRG
jgi:hypothetical protein